MKGRYTPDIQHLREAYLASCAADNAEYRKLGRRTIQGWEMEAEFARCIENIRHRAFAEGQKSPGIRNPYRLTADDETERIN